MKIVTYFLLAAAGTSAFVAPASAEVYSFQRGGIVYKVQDTVRNGVRVIEGTDSTGAKFSYRVLGNRIEGTYRGEPVAFAAPASAQQRRLALR